MREMMNRLSERKRKISPGKKGKVRDGKTSACTHAGPY